jgi:hypothetical protein
VLFVSAFLGLLFDDRSHSGSRSRAVGRFHQTEDCSNYHLVPTCICIMISGKRIDKPPEKLKTNDNRLSDEVNHDL